MSHLIHKRERDEPAFHFEPPTGSVPASASLREYCPPVYDQLPLHSCSANAISGVMLMLAAMNKRTIEQPSRLFLYYNAREREGDVNVDDGATIRNALDAAATPGVCAESLWPYDPAKVYERPPASTYTAPATRVLEYHAVARGTDRLRACIAMQLPVIFGINIYDSTAQHAQTTGVLPMPQANDQLMGGHAIVAVGYDDTQQSILALNSCGSSFGDQGYLHVPYAYFNDDKLTYDFWTIHNIG